MIAPKVAFYSAESLSLLRFIHGVDANHSRPGWWASAGHARDPAEHPSVSFAVAVNSIVLSYAGMHFELYRALLDTRATNSSNLESRSFKAGDWFDFL